MTTPNTPKFSDLLELQEDDQIRLLGRAWTLADAICALAEGVPYPLGGSRALIDTYGPYGKRPADYYPLVMRQARAHLSAARANRPGLTKQLWQALIHVGSLIGDPVPDQLSNEDASRLSSGASAQHSRIIARNLKVSQAVRDQAMAAAKAWAVELKDKGMTEVEIAERLGLSRPTVRAALGK